jgi:hypothetical protein
MKTKFLFLLSFVVLVACNSNDINNSISNKTTSALNILYKDQSPYLDWYLSDTEAFISYTARMYPTDTIGQQYERVRGAGDNTISLKNGVKIILHDDYKLKNNGAKTTLQLARKVSVDYDRSGMPMRKQKREEESGFTQNYEYNVQTATPINLIRPQVDNCYPIPMCYYDNFIVEWNGDPANDNGVVVIAEWTGGTMHGHPQAIAMSNATLVDDTGIAVLDTNLFAGMPDEASVDLWLIRGNINTITGEGEISLGEVLESDPDLLEELLAENPELLLQLQPFMLGSGAVTHFSFFLIREL